jgi:hypothetical protein
MIPTFEEGLTAGGRTADLPLEIPRSDLDPGGVKPLTNNLQSSWGNVPSPDETTGPIASTSDSRLVDHTLDLAKPAGDESAAVVRTTMVGAVDLARAESVTVTDNNANLVQDCSGKDLTIEASNSKLFLNGACRSLTITGNNNNVLAEVGKNGKVIISGEHNAVIWSSTDGFEPTIENSNDSNTVIHLHSKPEVTTPLIAIEATRLAAGPSVPEQRPSHQSGLAIK